MRRCSAKSLIWSGRSKNCRQDRHIVGPPHLGEYPTMGTVPDRVRIRPLGMARFIFCGCLGRLESSSESLNGSSNSSEKYAHC
ncbi:hypothetical protein WR25_05377 [Diploscapter pachys]|uniref:Uncharacterized protein n=1 Tax=Diploscapter pachys TaxID=2018661 RepID=A0A2A2K9Y1_9BILA|nr:hypothetical protein WR25_05377 [Diploscapter pachys]